MKETLISSRMHDERCSSSLLGAVLQIDGEDRGVRIRDLSRHGAQFLCSNPPAVNAVLTFKGRCGRVSARVAWTSGDLMGVQFLEPLSEEVVRNEFFLSGRE